MEVKYQFVHTEVNNGLEVIVNEKLDSLKEKYDWIVRAKVFFKEEKDDDQRGKICEMELSVPGQNLFAMSHEESFEKSISETFSDLSKQLRTRKGKLYRNL